jgi:hypothetical protein
MWPGTESNCRHEDFQSSALPTELPGHTCENNYLAGLLLPFKRFCRNPVNISGDNSLELFGARPIVSFKTWSVL